MTSVYSIGSGRQNKMFCLYHTFMEYRSYGSFERTHHVANLSTDYQKAVAKAKSIFKEYKDNSKLVIQEEWELNEIKRDGTSEQKNTHMTHIEDKVLYGGVNGTREAILALRSLRDTLGGEHDGNVSVKWDGAPAIFAGIDPRDNRFFVAKKGIFNKSPKVYKSDDDIDADTSGDLNKKFKLALQHLPLLGIKGVIQGDFLYSSADVKTQKIKGKSYVTFHPNTIVYAVPAGTPMAKEIKASKIGIVWHTRYTGNSFENMKASYDVNVSKLKKTKNVWFQDAMLRDMTQYTMKKSDTEEVNEYLSTAGKIFNQIGPKIFRSNVG